MVTKLTLEKIFENYSKLPSEDCAFVMQNFLLEALESETILEWQIAEKMMTLPDPGREILTKYFNGAIKKNNQSIGSLNVSSWIERYLEKYNGIPRTPNTFFEYCSKTPEIQRLAKRDQIRLMRIFRMYDYMLVEPIQDYEYPIENIFRFPMRLDSSPTEISAQVQATPQGVSFPTARTISEKMPLRDLLRKYPAVGEQMITAGQVKLASFDRPVRPSIRNWIYDYTSQLGQERHNSMQRMKYLFSSSNGKNLSSLDREKLGIILKSFDEDVPLPVDAGRNEIVFEINEQRPAANEQQPALTKTRPFAQSPTFPPPKADRLSYEVRNPSKPDFREIPQSQTLEGSSKPNLAKSPQESFIKPYSRAQIPAEKISATPRGIDPRPKDQPNPVQNDFVKPFHRPEMKPPAPIQPTQNKIPDTSYQIPNTQMQYANPYPKPETHEPQFSKPSENISSISFSDGLPQKQNAQPNFSAQPQQKNTPPQISSSRPRRNIIEPFSRPRPEPRIEGNVVDLRDNDH